MKKRILFAALALAALVALFVKLPAFTPSVPSRLVKVVVTGADGQRFAGRYVAEGVTNAVSAITPATLSLHARDVTYEFQRDGGDGEFRVALFVGDLCRTSATSDQRKGVRGELRYTAKHESYWAAGF